MRPKWASGPEGAMKCAGLPGAAPPTSLVSPESHGSPSTRWHRLKKTFACT